MTFWQENYHFIKDIYEMRHTKMAEWMENVEKSISRIMADRVYTSAEFKREREIVRSLILSSFLFSTLFRLHPWLKATLMMTGFVERSGESRYQEVASADPGYPHG